MVAPWMADWIEREIGWLAGGASRWLIPIRLPCDVIGAASRGTTAADRKRDETGCGAVTFRGMGCVVDSQ